MYVGLKQGDNDFEQWVGGLTETWNSHATVVLGNPFDLFAFRLQAVRSGDLSWDISSRALETWKFHAKQYLLSTHVNLDRWKSDEYYRFQLGLFYGFPLIKPKIKHYFMDLIFDEEYISFFDQETYDLAKTIFGIPKTSPWTEIPLIFDSDYKHSTELVVSAFEKTGLAEILDQGLKVFPNNTLILQRKYLHEISEVCE